MGGGHGRSKNPGSAAAILLVVLLVNLAISTRCTRQQLLSVAGGGSSGGTAAAAAGHVDGYGSKIYLIFCQKSKCVGVAGHDYTCYCCLNYRKPVCWMTMEDCRSTCPVCDPKCHPPLPLAARAASRAHPPMVSPVADDDYGRVSSLVGR
ncbi:uncharacterized protein LOC111257322 [Setaria italica]|uniref:uncharacterized protein LOC111257322 n=1 Tax=Setaria italica TaxID=4555 RepID=UPI000BE58C99|nr:uncharacterized protein LOC111257322 [Setaria italica]